jgi:hypothetical protein
VSRWRAADQARGFELGKDMLIRLSVLQTDVGTYRVMLSFHHIILDGWSMGIVLEELLETYTRLYHGEGSSASAEPSYPYRSYISWLQEQDKTDAVRYWQQRLAEYEQQVSLAPAEAAMFPRAAVRSAAGLKVEGTPEQGGPDQSTLEGQPTLEPNSGGQTPQKQEALSGKEQGPGTRIEQRTVLEGSGSPVLSEEAKTYTFKLNRSLTAALNRQARQSGVTLSTVFQTLWSRLLQIYNRTEDVLFGSVVSGRPSTLPGIERGVGMFINTVPVRVQSSGAESFQTWLTDLHEASLGAQAHEHCALYDIQAETDLQQKAINHVLVFENHPLNTEDLSR